MKTRGRTSERAEDFVDAGCGELNERVACVKAFAIYSSTPDVIGFLENLDGGTGVGAGYSMRQVVRYSFKIAFTC